MKTSRLRDTIDHISNSAVAAGATVLPAGAVLMVVRGMILAHSMPVARAERPLSFNQDIKAVVCRNRVDSEFLLYWLLANAQRLLSLTTESTHGTKRLPTETLFREVIALPSVEEQRAIAMVLSDVDALLTKLDQLIAKKRDLKRAAMQRLLGNRDASGRERTNLPEVPLYKICEFISKGSTPTTYGFQWKTSGVLFLRSECVSEQGLDLTQSMFISPAAHTVLRRSVVRDGDILITITGNVGRVVRFNAGCEANINQHIARIRVLASEVDAGYVFHVLSQSTYRARFNSITTGQAYPQISLKQVREAGIPMRSLPEQRRIAEVLSDMDAEITALEVHRNKTRQLKQGMMQALLTGRIRLT